jgi:DNA-binding Lrp family transcriptional regulator
MTMTLDATDRRLLGLLVDDARRPVAGLAAELGLARSTVQQRIRRLEETGVIAGYTVRIGAGLGDDVRAMVSIQADGRRIDTVVSALASVDEVRAVHTTSGEFDLVAIVSCPTTQALDRVVDLVGALPGVARTTTSVLLTTRFERAAAVRVGP